MEAMRPESSITLVIKTPNQRVEDIEVNCLLDWTVAKLKSHLTNVYPTNPSRSSQKIIYSGKLLDDHFVLKDVLLENDSGQQTVHLVCTPSVSELSPAQTTTNETTVSASEVISTTNTTTTQPNDGLRQRHAPPAFLSPPYHNIYQQNIHGYQPASYYTTGQHHIPPNVHNLMAAQHMAHMQWLHHMSQMMQGMSYTHHYPYHHAGNEQQLPNTMPAAPAEPEQPAAAPQAAAPVEGEDREVNQQRNMVMNANAGGGMMQEEDDDQDNVQRDWLDHIYMGVRIIMLLSIFWFYSSVERLVLMAVAMFVVWILQSGWFQINRRQNNRQEMANEQQEMVVEEVDDSDNSQSDDELQDDSDDDEITDNNQPGFFVVCYNFVTTFFLSLVPQGPRAVN